jgi:phage shock protein B
MDSVVTIVFVTLFMTIILPLLIIFHYGGRKKAMKAISDADQQELVALRDAASWMEKRIDNLESVLDTEAPGWRARSATR